MIRESTSTFLKLWNSKKKPIERSGTRIFVNESIKCNNHSPDLSAYEENLQIRREKLRNLLLNEEASLIREIEEKSRQSDDIRRREMDARAQELKNQQEKEQEALVAAKRRLQQISHSDIKQELSKRYAIDAKRCNVAQMADKEVKKLAEKELDAMCHKMMLKELETKERKEAEEAKRRTLAQRETMSTLAKQVADKLALEDERKRIIKSEREQLKQLQEDVRQAELKNLEAERQKREKLKKEFQEHILTTRKYLAERAQEEAKMDRVFKTMAEEELAKEKARTKKNPAALRAESSAYFKYLEELRKEEARRNLEMEAIIRQSHKDAEARRELALEKSKEARKRAIQEVLRGREEQLREKRETEEKERRLKMEEKEALERQIEMDANLTAMEQKESRQRALRYGLELKEQHKHVETMRRRELEEDRKFHKAETKRQIEEHQRLGELLKASENITPPHPFKILFNNCAGREPEREKHYSCSPALIST
ncbi:vicilin-like seed storage protein At2g18540 isoform X2 [Pseudomyrmex gracilis]|uniref:vicilin-like seed storage protein At2g18540 isoform X2 n=1 Tax=Pseudomyrmex gracilis TaxID=219809 RepID=UPI0009949459|nr:vicilin-like seed storage protein At2g18540 isoform X2 [Pseudomyrmex gracilis]